MNNTTPNNKSITTKDFEYFFKSDSWIKDCGNMIKLSNFVSSEYPTLIDFIQYYDRKMYENSNIYCNKRKDVDYNSRDVYDKIYDAINTYYEPSKMYLCKRDDYLDNYKIFQKIKTLFETVKYKSSSDNDHESIIRWYENYYTDFVNRKEYEKKGIPDPLPDVHSIFIPLSQRGDKHINNENFVPDIDIFVSLRPINKTSCNTVCESPRHKTCCKKVTDVINSFASTLPKTSFAITLPKTKEKIEGGKTRNKNKKHYSRRCKNRKNKKSCKKPHK